MRFLKIIIVAIASIFFSACVDLDLQAPNLKNTDEITLIGHITRFDDYNVATRAAKQGDESNITSYAMAIFHVKNGSTSDCVFFEHHSSGNQLLFTIDRSNQRYDEGEEYAIYVFANMPDMYKYKEYFESSDPKIKQEECTLEKMLNTAYAVNGIGIPENNGFPMIGSLGDYFSSDIDNDGKHFIMSPTAGEEPPTVDGTATTTLSVPMKALYAKMNFHIEVRPDQMIEGSSFPPQFELASYKLVNVPASVDFNKSTNADDSETNISVLDTITVEAAKIDNTIASGARAIDFTFYLPENLLVPQTNASEYDYPFKGTYDINLDKDQNGIRNEDEKYCQRYKGKLLGANQPATCIVLSGNFRDHQNHTVKVDYTIHLGKDNFSDFNIVRNSEYNNNITIKGILNSKENKDDYISLDHRVNVIHKEPTIISLRREVLLDSHFEIRPLRIKNNSNFNNSIAKYVKVEVLTPNVTKWMRLERSFGDGNPEGSPTNNNTKPDNSKESIYIDEDSNDPAYGKRRYFTYDLVQGTKDINNSLVESTEVIVPITTDGECVWIYVDECIEVDDDVRSGIIRVTYLDSEKQSITGDVNYPQVDYVINQRKLFKVTFDTDENDGVLKGRDYYIEYEEEYLHNFDSNDPFGKTDQEGMQWGLNNQQLSYEHRSIQFGDGLKQWLTMGARPYYDFYINKYDTADANDSGGTLHSYEGFDFCNNIIQVMNGYVVDDNNEPLNNNQDDNIDVLPLNQRPRSAVEYCYNKNKRNSDGHVVWMNGNTYNQDNLNWYLPAVDELEDIIVSNYGGVDTKTYSRFEDFQNKFYWSSQPAFIRNFAYYQGITNSRDEWASMYIDNVKYARATKVNYLGNDVFDYAKSGLTLEKDEDGNNVYYNAFAYRWGGILGSETYTPEDGTVTIDRKVTITLKELTEQIQEGYKSRTDMARVRCVRKMN